LDEPSLVNPEETTLSKQLKAATTSSPAKLRMRRRVVIVGIPGVGKSTVVNTVVKLMKTNGMAVNVVNYGTVMMEEAASIYGIRSRDDMRKLAVDKQRELQVHAASKISRIEDEFVIVDTHLFIATKEGFWPGMPLDVLQALRPTHLVLVTASIDEIGRRREADTTRLRDKATADSLQLESEAARSFLFASGVICGSPALIVHNSDGQVEETAKNIINSIFTN
jgi:adenylate kinase